MNGTTAFPGWYPEFQSAVLRQLPRPGGGEENINQATAERWTKNQGGLKRTLADVFFLDQLFEPVADAEITVPKNYIHETCLASFRKHDQKKGYSTFCEFNHNITDENFKNVSVRLVPGQRLKASVFQIKKGVGMLSGRECLAFLRSKKAIFAGAQGMTLAFEQAENILFPNTQMKGKNWSWCSSLDEEEALFERHAVAIFHAPIGEWRLDLSFLYHKWDYQDRLLCFTTL